MKRIDLIKQIIGGITIFISMAAIIAFFAYASILVEAAQKI